MKLYKGAELLYSDTPKVQQVSFGTLMNKTLFDNIHDYSINLQIYDNKLVVLNVEGPTIKSSLAATDLYNAIMLTLPEGYRPLRTTEGYLYATDVNVPMRIWIEASGQVKCFSNSINRGNGYLFGHIVYFIK